MPSTQLNSFLLWGLALVMVGACTRPFSPASYRQDDPEQLYATICHDGKRTLNVPAEDWPEHKAHGDSRGPCRSRGAAGPEKEKPPGHTSTSYGGRKRRAKRSRAAYEAQEARLAAVRDSVAALPNR